MASDINNIIAGGAFIVLVLLAIALVQPSVIAIPSLFRTAVKKRSARPATIAEVSAWIKELTAFLGGVKPPIEKTDLWGFFVNQNLMGLVRAIKRSFGLEELKMRVGVVNSGGNPTSPAWIKLPKTMPPYGTEEFKRITVTLYIRKEFLGKYNFESVVCAIAHEMSHIVLEATGHPLRDDEKVVDLTAMLSGFAELYVRGVTYRDFQEGRRYKLGYLTIAEVEHAASVIRRIREHPRPSPPALGRAAVTTAT